MTALVNVLILTGLIAAAFLLVGLVLQVDDRDYNAEVDVEEPFAPEVEVQVQQAIAIANGQPMLRPVPTRRPDTPAGA